MASKEELRKLMLAMNPDAEQIEEAAAAAPRVPGAAKALGKGFYEANVEPLLSPRETAMAIFGAGQEFVRDPKEFSKSLARAEMERLKAAGETPEAGAEYYGGMLSPFSLFRRLPKTEVVRPKGQGIVLDYPEATPVQMGDPVTNPNLRAPMGFVARELSGAKKKTRALVNAGRLEPETADAIDTFLDTKVRNYFVNQFGTKDDPIFKLIKEGRLSTPELQSQGRIREYLPTAAKEGKTRVDPATGKSTFYPSSGAQAALEDINRIYDELTGLKGRVISNRTLRDPKNAPLEQERAKVNQFFDETTQQLINEGNKPYEINPQVGAVGYKDPRGSEKKTAADMLSDLTPSEFTRNVYLNFPTADVQALGLSSLQDMPKSLRTAIEKGQPVYDIQMSSPLTKILSNDNLITYLGTLSPREIKNLRYEDAIQRSVKFEAQARDRAAMLDRIKNDKPVDKKIFMEGVSGPLISYSQEGPLSGFTWRQITDPEATAVEGAHMKHSVGGYAKNGMYGPDKHKLFKQGIDRVYTLRDPQGLPVVTVSVEQTAKGPVVLQTKAKKNTAVPEIYGQPLVDLFEKLNVSQIAGTETNFLPSLARAYQKQKADEIRGIRQIAAQEPPVPQQVPLPPARQPAPVQRPAPVQEGIGQINARPNINPAHLEEQLQRLAQDPQALRQQLRRPRGIMDYFQRYMMLRRRMMEDDDRGPEGEE